MLSTPRGTDPRDYYAALGSRTRRTSRSRRRTVGRWRRCRAATRRPRYRRSRAWEPSSPRSCSSTRRSASAAGRGRDQGGARDAREGAATAPRNVPVTVRLRRGADAGRTDPSEPTRCCSTSSTTCRPRRTRSARRPWRRTPRAMCRRLLLHGRVPPDGGRPAARDQPARARVVRAQPHRQQRSKFVARLHELREWLPKERDRSRPPNRRRAIGSRPRPLGAAFHRYDPLFRSRSVAGTRGIVNARPRCKLARPGCAHLCRPRAGADRAARVALGKLRDDRGGRARPRGRGRGAKSAIGNSTAAYPNDVLIAGASGRGRLSRTPRGLIRRGQLLHQPGLPGTMIANQFLQGKVRKAARTPRGWCSTRRSAGAGIRRRLVDSCRCTTGDPGPDARQLGRPPGLTRGLPFLDSRCATGRRGIVDDFLEPFRWYTTATNAGFRWALPDRQPREPATAGRTRERGL